MFVKINYNECLTNLACSIRKHFGLKYDHNTLPYVDEILEKNNPKNVVTILLDGMGSNIIDALLGFDSFLVNHRIKSIYSVFPATTVAATTSILTGKNPCETAMLGWDMYYKDLDKIITTFRDCEKEDGSHTPLDEAKAYKAKHMITKTIIDEINEEGMYKTSYISPYGVTKYKSYDEMFDLIENKCNEDGKKYIYAYSEEPDSTMHRKGCRCTEVLDIIRDFELRIKKLSENVKDTVIFVVADHGHLNVENIFLQDYPDITDCLIRNTSIEPRAVNFFVKEDKKELFKDLFNKHFGEDFDLHEKEEVIASHLFGDGSENEVFRDILGDYLAIGKTNKAILYIGNKAFKSQHAGYTDDEILVPLIVIES